MRIVPRNYVLAAVLVALGAAHFVPKGEQRPQREVVRLAPELSLESAHRIELRGAGRNVTIERAGEATADRDAIGNWVLPELFGYPADRTLVQLVLARLAELSTLDLLTEDPARHGEYGLAAGQGQELVVRDAQGRALIELAIARSAAGAAFVRRAGEAAVYGAGALPTTSSDVQAWRRQMSLLGLEARLVRRIEFSGPALAAPYVLERGENRIDRWRDGAGRELPKDAVERIVREAVEIYPERVLGPGVEVGATGAADSPLAAGAWLHITAQSFDGNEASADVAAPPEDGLVPAVGAVGPWLLGVRRTSLERLKTRLEAL